ncbi:chorismate mutase [Blattabacterium cuenoti]|nr:chorismate mutase [Blattabacterium cuenoti]
MNKDILNNNIDRSWIEKWNKPVVISGPCSAESEKQVLETAAQLNQHPNLVHIFRAGIWKPRTKPNNFEGIGEKGLEWLNKVKKNTGMLVATEVANKEHVKLCLSFNIDILWIGARSTASPFTVQEIANALEGNENTIVLVKNPIHPDIELWIGALERLLSKGIKNLGVIHRGFYTYKSSTYRNQPNWMGLLKFKKLFPRVPVICDPSHICGNRKGILDVAKQALSFHCEGLMIESHCNPDLAWSDGTQQITPKVLLNMINQLMKEKNIFSTHQEKLNICRILIEELDENIIILLYNRMNISRKLGPLKMDSDIATVQPERWNFIMDKYLSLGKKLNISEELLEKIFQLLHKESIKIQNEVRK